MNELQSQEKRKLKLVVKIRFSFAVGFNNGTYSVSQLQEAFTDMTSSGPQTAQISLSADINILGLQTRKRKLREGADSRGVLQDKALPRISAW